MEQKAFVGLSAIDTLYPLLKDLSASRIFLVRGKKSYESCGVASMLTPIFTELGCDVIDFYDFEENPKFEDMQRGLSLLTEYRPNLILSIGGGSVLDMAKLIRFFHSYSGDIKNGSFKKEAELIPLVALPTTAGTGSEATHFAVIYVNKVKYSVEHEDVLPDVAIVDPRFTYNNPKYLTACTGFDALAQAIEAYWNVNANKQSDEYACKAIKLLYSNLPLAVNNPNQESRNKVSEGSYWAGCAINITKTTAPHAFSYPFTTYYGYPHGHAVAMTFPFFAKYNIDNILKNNIINKQKVYYLSKLLNLNILFDCELLFIRYINTIGLNLKLPVNFDERIILNNINLKRLANNPCTINDEISIDLLKRMHERL